MLAFLKDQTFERFSETVDTKAKQFQNLDEISRQMKLNFDYFVVFSSVTCGNGNGGQTHYAYGNSVCERICEARRKDGLHGLAIQWGPIGDAGVIANEDMSSSLSTVVKQRINSCFEALDKLLQTNESIVSCVVSIVSILIFLSFNIQINICFIRIEPKEIHFQIQRKRKFPNCKCCGKSWDLISKTHLLNLRWNSWE